MNVELKTQESDGCDLFLPHQLKMANFMEVIKGKNSDEDRKSKVICVLQHPSGSGTRVTLERQRADLTGTHTSTNTIARTPLMYTHTYTQTDRQPLNLRVSHDHS